MDPIPWTCPYCNRDVTLLEANVSADVHYFENGSKDGKLSIITWVYVCPNMKCKEYTIFAYLSPWKRDGNGDKEINHDKVLIRWNLRPQSSAKPFPDYIPVQIRTDYEEACSIRDLSPKASATLARRCLQGMIRDFWGISKGRLVDELSELESRVDTLTWNAIDGLRRIGNIGAHMEKDINIITDVEPEEASMLISLIENLLKDWYVTRHDKEERYKVIAGLGK